MFGHVFVLWVFVCSILKCCFIRRVLCFLVVLGFALVLSLVCVEACLGVLCLACFVDGVVVCVFCVSLLLMLILDVLKWLVVFFGGCLFCCDVL